MKSIISYIKSLIEVFVIFKALIKMVEEAKKEGWIRNGRELAFKLEKATTDKERMDCAEKFSNHYDNMPKL